MTNYNPQASREWWAQRWLDLLDSYRFKKRLERARDYARQGNILSIKFQGFIVLAHVQGTEPEPYQVSLSLDLFTEQEWGYVIETMSQQAIFAAKLLAGEMPQNIEDVFTANGLSLFPFTLSDIRSECSCPDQANPCKHIGAVYYQLGSSFSEDPFVLFQLRGRTKDQIIAALRSSQNFIEAPNRETTVTQYETPKTQYPLKVDQFWQYNEPLESTLVVIAPPPSSETVLDFLGPIPLSSNTNVSNSASAPTVMQYLDTVYKQVSQQAVVSAMNLEASRSASADL